MINSQATLTGLKVNEPKATLTPPAQLLNKNDVQPVAQTADFQVELLPDPGAATKTKTSAKAALSKNDNLDLKNLITSGLAGGFAAARTSQDVGIIGESMRGMDVQQSMAEMQSRMQNNGYGNNSYNSNYSNNSNYNNNDYNSNNYNSNYNNNDYGSTEYVRRGNYGRSESLFGRRNGYTEYDPNGNGYQGRSPEMSMALNNIATGTIQGAKHGIIIGGVVSAAVNAFNVVSGKSSSAEAVGMVAADTVTAGISGASGALAGGFASLGLGIIGIGGMPGLVLATGVGVAGAVASQFLLQKSGIYDSLKEKVMGMVSGKK